VPENEYDIVTVGGGLGGSSLAKVMAEKGARVLVLEREREFKDRVRGEAMVPWGVAEAQELGIYDLLCETCGHKAWWFDVFLGPLQIMHRDLQATTPRNTPMLGFYHPEMQEILISAAAKAGAVVRRGAFVTEVRQGARPSVNFQHEGMTTEVKCRLVVGTDGRVSATRKWAGFSVERDPPTLMMSGILFEGMRVPDDTAYILTNPALCQGAFLFPQGGGRVRSYFAYPINAGFRLQGESDVPRFIQECVRTGVPAEYYRDVKPRGPLASFETADTWVGHPYKEGIALLGDSAASSDPTWGNGLSLTLRGVRALRDRLLANENWDVAGHEYSEEHDRFYGVIHDVTTWFHQMFMESGPEADARRAKAMPLIAGDPTRVPDHGMSGPDIPFEKDTARARFFGDV
jgi:2-polyprenyl-6-methoxyphenol hydroxylase-like FAD-dependent oxidoreductase